MALKMAADHEHDMIPGLFDAGGHEDTNHGMSLAAPVSMVTASGGRSILDELLAEKGSLGPNFAHSIRLLDEEILRVKSGGKDIGKGYFMMDGNKTLSERVYIPQELQKQHNIVGRLLGPKGMILKGIQSETQTRISILGRGSIKDRKREEDMRNSNDPQHAHLKDDLHIQIEGSPPNAHIKLAAGVAEINKMMVPPPIGQPDNALARYLDPNLVVEGYSNAGGPPRNMPTPSSRGRGGGRGGGGRGGGPRGGGGRGGRGGRGGGGDRGSGRGGGRGSSRGRPSYERNDHGGNGRGYHGGGGSGSGHSVDPYPDTRMPMGSDLDRDTRDRHYPEERRSLSDDYGRPSTDSYSSEADSYYSFTEKPLSRSSQYGGYDEPHVGYPHNSSSDWKSPRSSRREGSRHHPYSQGTGGYM